MKDIDQDVPHLRTELPGPIARGYLEESSTYEPVGYSHPIPAVWDRAQGCTVVDVDGNSFLDFTSGIAVMNVGHSRPEQISEICKQAEKLIHCYNFVNAPRVQLARKLVEISPSYMTKACILTTGSEVIELSVRAARKITGRHEILAFSGAFHGRTYMALSLGGKAKHKRGVGPFASGILRAPFPYCYRCPDQMTYPQCSVFCTRWLDAALEDQSSGDLAAVIIESFQAAGGMVFPPPEYFRYLGEWCKSRNVLLIVDEIQSAFGRTGRWFAFEHYGIQPNMVCIGKGVSCGGHLAAVIGEGRILDAFEAGTLTTSDGGNPLSCVAALAAIDLLAGNELLSNATEVGSYLMSLLGSLHGRTDSVGDIRGLGLAVGIEVVSDKASRRPAPELARSVVFSCYRHGLLVNWPTGIHGNVIALTPPLIVRKRQVQTAVEILTMAFDGAKAE